MEKEEREKGRTFPQKVFPSRIRLLHNRQIILSILLLIVIYRVFFSQKNISRLDKELKQSKIVKIQQKILNAAVTKSSKDILTQPEKKDISPKSSPQTMPHAANQKTEKKAAHQTDAPRSVKKSDLIDMMRNGTSSQTSLNENDVSGKGANGGVAF